MDILVVDDLSETRSLLSMFLRKLGHRPITAENGAEALSILQNSNISLVLSDWMMPVMDGIELCETIRKTDFGRYIYFIMITARGEKEDILTGMESGADDYITKPYMNHEIKVRISAGVRILELEHKLETQNTELTKINQALQKAQKLIESDLETAAALQHDLLPKARMTLHGYKFDWVFLPCNHTAGDIFNFFELDEDHIGFYQLDVAGHGVASAMLSFTLSKFLSPIAAADKARIYSEDFISSFIEKPSALLQRLNKRFFKHEDAMQYFTICCGVINRKDDIVTISRGGHPFPLLINKYGEIQLLDHKGIPIGMLADADFNDEKIQMKQGDRLYIYSDGVLECSNPRGELFGQARLIEFLGLHKADSISDTLDALQKTLHHWREKDTFEDDVTVLGIEKQ